jgi:predicted porin
MKRTWLSFVVLGALTGAASAQVTLSGSVDFSLRNADGEWKAGTAGAGRNQFTIADKEDLGGGLYAFTHLQSRFRLTDGTISTGGNFGSEAAKTTQFFRNAYVGLGGGFGEVRLGRLVMPMNIVNGDYDPFGTDYLAGVHTDAIKATVRANGAIEYFTPNLNGFTATVGVAGSDGQLVTGAKGVNPFGLSVRYAAGPIDAAMAYDKNAEDLKTVGVYGSYKLDSGVKLMTQYERGDWSTTSGLKVARWSVGVNVPMGDLLLRAGYILKKDEDVSKLGVGADYFMSKRTSAYSDISKQAGSGNAQTALISADNRKVRYEIGMRHRF